MDEHGRENPHAAPDLPPGDAPPPTVEPLNQPPPPAPLPVPPPRRVWPALVVALLAIIASQIGAAIGIAAYVGVLALRGELDLRASDLAERITALIMTPEGLLFAVIPTEMVLLCAALIPAWLSKEPGGWRQRLGLVRGTLPAWGLLLLLPAQVFVLGVIQLAYMLLFDEASQHLTDLSGALTGATGLLATVMLLTMSVLPGVAEELLDRGYLQRRLIRRWGPIAGIAVSSLIFGLAHLDPQHALMTALLGVWFGVVAWRTNAVWPAMVCHAFGNFVGIALAMLAAQDAEAAPPAAPPTSSTAATPEELRLLLLVIAATAPFFIAAIVLLRRCGRHVPRSSRALAG